MERLPQAADLPGNPLELERADALYREGMALYRDEYFGDAATRFESAIERLTAIEQALQAFAAERLAAAGKALDNEDFETAAAEYEAASRVLPLTPEASAGLSTAQQGIAARKLLDEARQFIEQGDFEGAESRLDAIAAGTLSDSVGQARRQIQAAQQQQRLNQSLSRGFRHLDRGEWQQAEAAFAEALRSDPGSVAARDALQDLQQRRTDAELAAYRTRLETERQAENWPEARDLLERMHELDPDDAETAGDLARISQLVDVEERIDGYLSRPQRLSAKGARDQVAALLETTATPETLGTRIAGKREQLLHVVATWTTPVEITIRSDNRTVVRIRPGRVLGTFRERRLEVYPGDYVLTGRRVGYREVALPVAVPPGADAFSVEVVCHVRF